MGAETVIAVDVGAAPQNVHASGIYEIVMQSFEIMGLSIAKLEDQKADVLIRPAVGQFSSSDFSNRAQLIAAGYSGEQRAIEQIRLAQNSNYKKRK